MSEVKNENLEKQFKQIILPLAEQIYDKKINIQSKFALTDENSFNIFSLVVNDNKYLEKFHDRALFAILNPKTQNIGNTVFLEKFLEAIGVDLKDFSPLDETIVQKKKRTFNISEDIDIFIYNEKKKNAIIIEDKLYDAKDQPNQLARYYKYVTEEMNFNVSKIVYLPLTPDKKPDLKVYSDKLVGMTKKRCEKIVNEIEEKNKNGKYIVIMPAVVSEKGKKDITHDWLGKIDWDNVSYRNENNKKLAQVFVSQYKNLLLGLGEDELMAEKYQEIMDEIQNNEKKFSAVFDFVEMWNKEFPNIPKSFSDYIMERDDDYKNQYDKYLFWISKKKNGREIWFATEIGQDIALRYHITHKKADKDEIKKFMSSIDFEENNHFKNVNCNFENKEEPWGQSETYRISVYKAGEKSISKLKEIAWKNSNKLEKAYDEKFCSNKK